PTRASCAIIRRMTTVTRRDVLRAAATAPIGAWARALDAAPLAIATGAGLKRAVLVSMLPSSLGWKDRFALAKAVGFDGIEMQTMTDRAEAEAVAGAGAGGGPRVPSGPEEGHSEEPAHTREP